MCRLVRVGTKAPPTLFPQRPQHEAVEPHTTLLTSLQSHNTPLGGSMEGLLDRTTLDGVHEAQIAFRPARFATPFRNYTEFIETIRYQCQLWSGANAPLIPMQPDGSISAAYRKILAGSAIDDFLGLQHPFDLFRLPEEGLSVGVDRRRDAQLAVALLEPHHQGNYLPVEVVETDGNDPWQGIYAACLGLLPSRPDERILRDGNLLPTVNFEDFVTVRRVTVRGSLDDLLGRLESREHVSPRPLSMVHLSYGSIGSTGIRSRTAVLPEPTFARYDAGPNVVVICSPGNVDDLALLWNLRCAYGDFYSAPIGIPIGECSPGAIAQIALNPRIARHGFSAANLYVTSASLGIQELRDLLPAAGTPSPGRPLFDIASYAEMLDLGGAAGWSRNELLVWNRGEARFVPFLQDSERELFTSRAMSTSQRMWTDLSVSEHPFPALTGRRINGPSFSEFRAGRLSRWLTPPYRSEPKAIAWPSSLLMAEAVASAQGLDIRESEPGRAARIAIESLRDISDLGFVAHAPLLSMLEEMAARQGFGWYKARLRAEGGDVDPIASVGPTADTLPERTFGQFKSVLGNSDKATKFWLHWAERAGYIVKGFQLQCDACLAKQWIPVAAFMPPIVCRGCAEHMSTPFGNRPSVDFRYRLSERLRRVYEQDAMGHLLAARFLHILLGSGKGGRNVGLHPGMEVKRKDREGLVGEADVLLLTKAGEFVPIEVKRTSAGFNAQEVAKLDRLCDELSAPWSGVATCEYGRAASAEFRALEARTAEHERFRIILSYDVLLEPYPVWAMGSDPFAWNVLTDAQILEREAKFVTALAGQGEGESVDWLSYDMLRSPRLDIPRS